MKACRTPVRLLVVVALACASGCGGGAATGKADWPEVTGSITENAKPAGDVEVLFVPEDGGNSVMGITDAEGRYRIATVAPGEYQVRLMRQSADAQPDPAFAERFGEDSPLAASVSASNTSFDFDVAE